MNKQEIYRKEYLPYMIRWGRITNTVGIVLGFVPAMCLWVFFGLTPNWSAVGVGVGGIIAALGVAYFTDPIACVPVIGVAGTMQAYLSGNANNLRIPCSVLAQDVAKTEPGTPEAEVISILGMSVSVVVNIIVLIICAVGGSALIGMLPPSASASLNYMLPCVFGAVFMQFALKLPKMVPVCLGCGLLLRFGVLFGILPSRTSSFITLICVIVTIAVGIRFYKLETQKEQAGK